MDKDRKHICSVIESLSAQINNISQYLKDHPETAFNEIEACRFLSHQLRESAFDVQQGIGDVKTAFVAKPTGMNTRRPTVALLAEYDALPKIGHGCGHNLIAAAGLGAGMGLKASIGERMAGVVVIGTPAEEGAGGKALIAEAGGFEGIDVALMFHPSSISIAGKNSLGRIKFSVEFFGRTAHAAGSPDEGHNALEGLILAYNAMNALRQHLRSDQRIHGIITHGGDAPNIIPDYAAGLFYVRAGKPSQLMDLFERVEQCVQGAAMATHTKAKVEIVPPKLEPLKRNPALEAVVANNMVELDVSIDSDDGRIGSSDIGNLSQILPAAHPYLAIIDPDEGISGHSVEFCNATTSVRGRKVVVTAAKLLALTAYDFLTSTDLQARIKKDFDKPF